MGDPRTPVAGSRAGQGRSGLRGPEGPAAFAARETSPRPSGCPSSSRPARRVWSPSSWKQAPLLDAVAGVGQVTAGEGPVGLVRDRAAGLNLAFEVEAPAMSEAERAKLNGDLRKIDAEIAGARGRLSNARFLERAPAHVVEGNRARLAELEEQRRRVDRDPGALSGKRARPEARLLRRLPGRQRSRAANRRRVPARAAMPAAGFAVISCRKPGTRRCRRWRPAAGRFGAGPSARPSSSSSAIARLPPRWSAVLYRLRPVRRGPSRPFGALAGEPGPDGHGRFDEPFVKALVERFLRRGVDAADGPRRGT